MANIPPHNLEAEQAILGGVLVAPAAIAKIKLRPEEFYAPAHQKIWKVILGLVDRNQPVDFLTVSEGLGNDLEQIGGVGVLLNMADSTVSAVNVDRYAAIVHEKYQRRKLIAACQTLLTDAFDTSVEWEELRNKAEAELTTAIADKTTARGLRHISEFMPEIWKQLEEGKNSAIPTGLNYFDQCLDGGLRGGELVVVAGRPAMGKTFVAQFASRILANQGPVAVFSLEMSADSITRRYWATEANLPQSWLNTNSINPQYIGQLADGAAALSSLPIFIDDTPGDLVTVPYLQSECHKIYRQHQKMGAIVVDYLQLIGDQGSGNRVGELGRYSSALKSLAKTFDCPVIALSQLSRGVEGRNDKRPVMSDIRSSGAIEQDADVIVMLYRDEYYNPNTPDQGILELILAKNRHGVSGVTAKANFDPSVGTITNFVSYGGSNDYDDD
jgi:replicative DNA helicase